MRALRLHEFGSPSGLRMKIGIPDAGRRPCAGAGFTAASVNPSDVKNVRGFMHQTRLPRTGQGGISPDCGWPAAAI